MRWIIGDIHGMLRPLSKLLEVVRARDAGPQFLFVGDYVNRGPDSHGVIERLLGLQAAGQAQFVRGNHDDIFDQVLHGQCYAENATHGDRVRAFQWFMQYGLDSTFMSYGADIAWLQHLAAHPDPKKLQTLAEGVPESHRRFIRALPATIEFDDLVVFHGKWPVDEFADAPGVAARLEADPRLRHALLWGRYTEDEIVRVKAWRRTAYVGHTPVSHYKFPRRWFSGDGDAEPLLPLQGPKLVLLDTAAALSFNGRLTAYCPDTGAYVQTNHFGEMIEEGEE